MAKRVFVSFDFDNDKSLKDFLIGQSRLPHSPFTIHDWSLKEEQKENEWLEEATKKIKRSDIVIVMLGDKTFKASGVLKEVKAANANRIKCVQLKKEGTNPTRVENAGVVYDWNWDNLEKICK